MKRTLWIGLVMLSLVTPPASAQTGMVKILVTGIVCAFCSQGLTRVFSAQPAVDKVDVNLDTKVVSLKMKDGKNISDAKLQSMIEDAGFNVVKIER